MRHFVPASPVAATAFGMREAAPSATLIATAGGPQRGLTSGLGAAAGAIDLAPVAMAADEHLRSAADTEEPATGTSHWRSTSRQREFDRDLPLVKYSPCTRAQHDVGRGSGLIFEGFAAAVPVLLGGFFLPHPQRSCYPSVTLRDGSPTIGPTDRHAAGGGSPVALRAPSDTPPAAPSASPIPLTNPASPFLRNDAYSHSRFGFATIFPRVSGAINTTHRRPEPRQYWCDRQKKARPRKVRLFTLVETGGIEPPTY